MSLILGLVGFGAIPVCEEIARRGIHEMVPLDLSGLDDPNVVAHARRAFSGRVAQAVTLLDDIADDLWADPPAELRGAEPKTATLDVLARSVQEQLPRELMLLDTFENLVAARRPDAIVLWQDLMWDGKCIALAARAHGIPTLHIPHGYITSNPDPARSNVHDRSYCSNLASFGPRMAEYYMAHGYPADAIEITGNPLWDQYAELADLARDPARRAGARSSLGIDPDLTTVMYASSSSGGHARFEAAIDDRYDLFLEALSRVGRAHDDIQLMVKLHPADTRSPAQYAARARELGVGRVRAFTAPKELPLAVSDLLVMSGSNMGIEAMLVDVPVVDMLMGSDPAAIRLYTDRDPVLPAFDLDELAAGMEAALYDEETIARLDGLRPASVERFNHGNDGGATRRAADIVDRMVERGSAGA